MTPPQHPPAILVGFPNNPALSLLAQTFSQPLSIWTIMYSPSPHISAALLLVLPLSLSLLPFSCLPRLFYVVCSYLPSSSYVDPAMLSPPWAHYFSLETLSPVLLVFQPLPWESPACLGPKSTYFRFPSPNLPRQGSSPAACDYLPHFPLLCSPKARFSSLLHVRPGYLLYGSMFLP